MGVGVVGLRFTILSSPRRGEGKVRGLLLLCVSQ
jgi:hypothetical protein